MTEPHRPLARILLVDPHRKTRRVRAKALAATGCSVDVVDSLESAVERLSHTVVDLVVADYTEFTERMIEAAR